MPELPEVQTVVSQLERKVTGKKVTGFWSDWKKKVLDSYLVFVKKVTGATLLGARRFGKHIVIDLDNGFSIVIHLKMTGHLLYKNKANRLAEAFIKDPMNGFIHHRLTFSDGSTLEFSDMRKFGWLRAVRTTEVEDLPSIRALGIDALSRELSAKRFEKLLSPKKNQTIAAVLLEQGLVAGVGNIYRSEALFLSGVLPTRLVREMKKSEWGKLLSSLKTVLRRAVKLRGMSDGDFRDTDGLPGRFQRTLFVYRRTGLPCKTCDTIIERKKIGQRSVFFCPRCQK